MSSKDQIKLDKYESYVLISRSIAKCIATVAMFAGITFLFYSNQTIVAFFLESHFAGLIFLGFISGLVAILWAKDPVRYIAETLDDEEDEEDDDEEEDDEKYEYDDTDSDCKKCGSSLEIYDPKPLCAECKAEVEYYSRRSGVKEGDNHAEN